MDGFSSNFNNMGMILRVQSSESNVGDNDTNMTSATVSMKDSDEDFSMIASINRMRRGNSLGLGDENNNNDENDLMTLDTTPPLLNAFGSTGSLVGDMLGSSRNRNRTESRTSWGSLQRMQSIEYHENSLGALSNDARQFSRNLSDSG